jgi:hypothetical protein
MSEQSVKNLNKAPAVAQQVAASTEPIANDVESISETSQALSATRHTTEMSGRGTSTEDVRLALNGMTLTFRGSLNLTGNDQRLTST